MALIHTRGEESSYDNRLQIRRLRELQPKGPP